MRLSLFFGLLLVAGCHRNSGPTVDTTATTGASAGGGAATGVIGPEAVAAFDALSQADNEKIKKAKVFFGHQSVGMNTLDGAAALGFKFDEVSGAKDYAGPKLGHAYLDSNKVPLDKIKNFDAFMGKIGGPDVAAMKLCWIDFEGDTEVAKIQKSYVETINKVVAANPKVHLFHVTTPLKTDEPAFNKSRLAYGDWLKNTYKDKGLVLDLAMIQSTKPDGSACMNGGVRALCSEYASDEGHLNDAGQKRAAKAFLYAIYKSL